MDGMTIQSIQYPVYTCVLLIQQYSVGHPTKSMTGSLLTWFVPVLITVCEENRQKNARNPILIPSRLL